MAEKAVLYNGNEPLDVPIETVLHAMHAILHRNAEGAFVEAVQKLPAEQRTVVMAPALVNLFKILFEEKALYDVSPEAMDIMRSPPERRTCWPRNTI